MTVGEKLKRERKKQKLTLDEISQKTKIGIMFLIALEEDDLEQLPGGIYSRNFLRAYGKCLRMDEDILTAEFHEQHVTKPTSVIHREQTSQDNVSFVRGKRKGIFLIVLLIAILAFLGVMGTKIYNTWISSVNTTPGAVYQFKGSHLDKTTGDDLLKEESPTEMATESTSSEKPLQPDSSQSISRETKLNTDSESEKTIGELESPISSTESELAEGETSEIIGTLEPIEPETIDLLEKPVPDEPRISRPIMDSVGLSITNLPKDHPVNPSIDELFIIFADRDVWLEVSIDGMEVTRRLLKKGKFRVYRYGNENQITCGDFTRVSIQDGRAEVSTSHMISGVRETLQFERGGLADIVANAMNKKNEE